MKERVISSVVFVLLMLGGVFGGLIPFLILTLLIAAGCLWELLSLLLSEEGESGQWRRFIGLGLGLMPFVLSAIYALWPGYVQQPMVDCESIGTLGVLKIIPVLIALIFSLFLLELFLNARKPFQVVGNYLLGVFYIGIPLALLVGIATPDIHYEPGRPLGIMLLTWTNDTAAYLVGSRTGRHPLFPRISPGKTWEGTVGGTAFTLFIAWLLSMITPVYSLTEWLLIALCIILFGTLGDLVESMLKRSLDVKDSGSILPGHGGFMDRFDSMIFALPFIWLVLEYLS